MPEPDKSQDPGKKDGTPGGDDQLALLRTQITESKAATEKVQKQYDDLRSLGGRKDQELGELREAKRRLEELTGASGSGLADEDQRKLAAAAQADKDRYKVARLSYMVRHGLNEKGLETAEEFVRGNSSKVEAFDQLGNYDYDRILDSAGMHLREIERETKLVAFEKVEKEAAAAAEKDRVASLPHAGILGQPASEGTKQIDLKDIDADGMVDAGLVPTFADVPRVSPKKG